MALQKRHADLKHELYERVRIESDTPAINSPVWQINWESACQPAARGGRCWDNAPAKSFFATIKREPRHRRLAQPDRRPHAIFDFIEGWYNVHRLHSSLGYRSPAESETALAA